MKLSSKEILAEITNFKCKNACTTKGREKFFVCCKACRIRGICKYKCNLSERKTCDWTY